MILVSLGTNDKSFIRLLKAVDDQIKKGNIKDKVIVQAGYTKYNTKNMEIFNLIPIDEWEELVKKADLIITHGGVGTILNGIQNNKKIIAAARLKEYDEHVNNHQLQIIENFVKLGYILELKDFSKLDEVLKASKKFKVKEFKSNTKNFVKVLENYIDKL
ncbi:MAG: glycosyltransferase [Bacilli bacterium]|nr:glycosyltransferase [Bacilli bacterium]